MIQKELYRQINIAKETSGSMNNLNFPKILDKDIENEFKASQQIIRHRLFQTVLLKHHNLDMI